MPAAKPVAKANGTKTKPDWFTRIAKIATSLGDTEYAADDVRMILKAWRMEYSARKKAAKEAAKAEAAVAAETPAKPKKKVVAAAAPAEEEEEEGEE